MTDCDMSELCVPIHTHILCAHRFCSPMMIAPSTFSVYSSRHYPFFSHGARVLRKHLLFVC